MVLAANPTGVSAMPTMPVPANAGESQPLLVDEPTAAKMLGVSPRSVWTMAACGELPSVRIGRRKLYAVETLRRWIAERETAGPVVRS
jgi:predicted DNA-binding transcriptional regulator AlpA